MSKAIIKFQLLLLLVSATASACAQTQVQSVEIINAWAWPALSGDNGSVYFEIENPGKNDETLLRASSQVADKTEIHQSMVDSAGTMSMHPQHSVAVPAGGTVRFEPGGLHVMLVSLNRNLELGDTFDITLTFEDVGDQTIHVEVKQP